MKCLVAAFAVFWGVSGARDEDCASNRFRGAGGGAMRFTKEASFAEFGLVGRHKALRCCAEGYKSIEWYKDDKPYPWALETSGLIIFPASLNQTIYAQSAQQKDEGNYTCYLRNETVVHSHTIRLKIFDKGPDEPKVTYISGSRRVALGAPLRLFCEAYVGQVDLPDARSDVYWMKISPNSTMVEVEGGAMQKKTTRDEDRTIGTYLTVNGTRPSHFGRYACVIAKPGVTVQRYVRVDEEGGGGGGEGAAPGRPPPPLSALAVAGVVLASAGAALLWGWRRARLALRDAWGGLGAAEGRRRKDALVVCDAREAAGGVLAGRLRHEYGYECDVSETGAPAEHWFAELKDEAEKYGRIVAVLSPGALRGGRWAAPPLAAALERLLPFRPKLICVSLAELPEPKEAAAPPSLARSMGVIVWERTKEENFWYALRLKFPPKRKNQPKTTTTTTTTTDSRLGDNSPERRKKEEEEEEESV